MIIEEWVEFGHRFQIRAETDKKGRQFRLYDNGHPAGGGQWHHSIDSAKARAEYVLLHDYVSRIIWLEQRVNVLERELAKAKQECRSLTNCTQQ